jgi:hypothetical protein
MLDKPEGGPAAESEVWKVTLTTTRRLIYLQQSSLPSQTGSWKGIRKLLDKVKKRTPAPVVAQDSSTTTNPSPSILVQDPISNHHNHVSAVLTLGMPGVQ